MNRIDLHIHSVCSDSSLTVAQILSIAKESRMQMISITDHDTFAAYRHIPYDMLPCTLIKGIEISAFDDVAQRQVHILGYGFGEDTPHVDALCEATLCQRRAISLWQVQQLIDHGYQISLKEVECMAQQSTAIYKQHIMDVMIRHGYSDTIYSDVYRKLFKNNGICVCPFIRIRESPCLHIPIPHASQDRSPNMSGSDWMVLKPGTAHTDKSRWMTCMPSQKGIS